MLQALGEQEGLRLPNSQSRQLAAARLGTGHGRALAHGDVRIAQRFGTTMCALPPPDDTLHLELRCVVCLGSPAVAGLRKVRFRLSMDAAHVAC